jgi:hypothetical protein
MEHRRGEQHRSQPIPRRRSERGVPSAEGREGGQGERAPAKVTEIADRLGGRRNGSGARQPQVLTQQQRGQLREERPQGSNNITNGNDVIRGAIDRSES